MNFESSILIPISKGSKKYVSMQLHYILHKIWIFLIVDLLAFAIYVKLLYNIVNIRGYSELNKCTNLVSLLEF